MTQKFIMESDWVSQQTDKLNRPLVELKKGDLVELKDDEIYFTRKINVGNEVFNRQSVFNDLKESQTI